MEGQLIKHIKGPGQWMRIDLRVGILGQVVPLKPLLESRY